MKYKRIFFCIPEFPNPYGAPTHPHAGIGYLTESLNALGVQTQVADLRLDKQRDCLEEKIKRFSPDLFGVTIMSYYHDLAYNLIERLKKYGLPVAIGGPHVSTLQEDALRESGADFGFMMESERSLADFCSGRDHLNIPGLIYRDGDNLVTNPPQVISDLDDIPYPRYRDFDLAAYSRRRIPIITSRGCPCLCTFCPIVTVMGRKCRLRSADKVLSEIKYWCNQGYRDFDFQDDNFTVDKNRVRLICAKIKQAGYKDLFIQCGNGIRADMVDKQLLLEMRDAGFRATAIGVESINREVLKRSRKGETPEQITLAVKSALEVGMEVSLFFIVGLPGETTETFEESLDFALKYPVTTATFYNLIPFPGTELYRWVKEGNLLLLEPKKYLNRIAHLEFVPVFETPEFSAKERIAALKKGARVNLLIKRRDMERKLGDTFLSRAASYIIYSTWVYNLLFFLIKINWVKKILNFILLKLRIRLNL